MKRTVHLLFAIAFTAVAAGCVSSSEGRSPVRVERSGFFVGEEQLGAGAILRNDTAETVRDIEIRVTFLADGRRLGEERDELPYCPPRTGCPWGQLLYGEHLGAGWRDVDVVMIDVTGHGRVTADRPSIDELSVRADADQAVVRRSGSEATAYLLAFDGATPRSGISFFTARGERGKLRYSQQLFERDPRDRVRAFSYAGEIPGGVGGPVD